MSQLELRFGTVQEFAQGRARVLFEDRDQVVSPWLPVGYRRTKDDIEYEPLVEGEPVACLLADNGESGLVLCSTYTDAFPPPEGAEKLWTRKFKDGTSLTYDRESKKLSVACEGAVEVVAKGNGTLKATGAVTVEASGALTVKAATSVSLEAPIVNLN